MRRSVERNGQVYQTGAVSEGDQKMSDYVQMLATEYVETFVLIGSLTGRIRQLLSENAYLRQMLADTQKNQIAPEKDARFAPEQRNKP